MQWTSIVAIYTLIWIGTAFVSLPFGIRTHEEMGMAKTPGQADSAPANFRPKRLLIRTTIIAALLTGLYIANYANGWITADDIDIFSAPSRNS